MKRTPLYDLHLGAEARMAEFAGYEMPIRYPLGTIGEHLHTRTAAGLFDVSHMGVVEVAGQTAALELESLMPADLLTLGEGESRYSFLTNDRGGILDDLIVTNAGDHFNIVVNAATKHDDVAHFEANLGTSSVVLRPDVCLLALQGPGAAAVLGAVVELPELVFMKSGTSRFEGETVKISRSGYTGEDGFELTVPSSVAGQLASRLLGSEDVEWIGLGARDTLRLEAGLCLYGSDLDESTTPVEARLTWAIAKRRRVEGGYPGADVIDRQLAEGPRRKRVGLAPEGRAPVRAGAELLSGDGERVGVVTSGTFGPSVDHPVAMGYVTTEHATTGTPLTATQRGREHSVIVAKTPFVQANYVRE